MRNGVKAIVVGSLLGLGAGGAGCGGGGSAEATERLWVSNVPTSAKENFSAFLTARSGGEYVGAFYRGSFARGSHDVFKWRDKGKGRAEIVLMQDDRKVQLKLDTCKPSTGFDYCLIVDSDLTDRPVKYQSRKRWVVRRPGKRGLVGSDLFDTTLFELAEDDEELAAALDAAAAAAEADWPEDPEA